MVYCPQLGSIVVSEVSVQLAQGGYEGWIETEAAFPAEGTWHVAGFGDGLPSGNAFPLFVSVCGLRIWLC